MLTILCFVTLTILWIRYWLMTNYFLVFKGKNKLSFARFIIKIMKEGEDWLSPIFIVPIYSKDNKAKTERKLLNLFTYMSYISLISLIVCSLYCSLPHFK